MLRVTNYRCKQHMQMLERQARISVVLGVSRFVGPTIADIRCYSLHTLMLLRNWHSPMREPIVWVLCVCVFVANGQSILAVLPFTHSNRPPKHYYYQYNCRQTDRHTDRLQFAYIEQLLHNQLFNERVARIEKQQCYVTTLCFCTVGIHSPLVRFNWTSGRP